MDSAAYNPPDVPLSVLHADHEILVLDKPAGLLSVPGKGPELADCLLARAQAAFPTALLVHRLDRDTSGVMVFGLTPHAQRHLGLQFEKRQVAKDYIARVWGVPEARQGAIELPLTVDWPNRPRQMVCHETGRPALTRWKLVSQDASTARLKLSPETGRSHQLRVHLREIGHPILGDALYATGPARDFPRLMLHAETLRLRHPDGGKTLRFRSAPPF